MIIDATERRHYRPKNDQQQKALYSGKKKAHTIKNTIIVDLKRYIHLLGITTQGSIHDIRLLDLDLLSKITNALKQIRILVDLGYLAINDYIELEHLVIPFKKPRKSKDNPKPELTDEQKQFNKELSAQRVIVEHVLAHIKRFAALTHVYRNRTNDYDDLFIIIAASIHNLALIY